MARFALASILLVLLPGIVAAADHDLVIVSATIKPAKANGKAWDAFKGLPDPFVQAGVAPGKGRMPTAWQKTAVARDTLEPRWDEKLLFVALGDEVVLQVWDKDVSVHDAIGDYRFTVTRELVTAGKRTVQFGQVKELTFLVQPREVTRKPVPPDPPAKPEDPETLRKAIKEGNALETQGRLAEAIQQYEKAAILAPRVFGANNTNTATLRALLGKLYLELGLYDQAEPHCRASLAICKAAHGEGHPRLAQPLELLAQLYFQKGQYAQVESLLRQSVEIREKRFGPDHQDLPDPLGVLAQVHVALGQYDRAEPLLKRRLKILEDRAGEDRPSTALAMNDLAYLYFLTGRQDSAEKLYRKCLAIREGAFGIGDDLLYLPHLAAGEGNLALLYQEKGQLDRAAALLSSGLKLLEDKLGKNHPEVAVRLNQFALLQIARGRADDAETLNRRSLRIWEGRLDVNHHKADAFVTQALLEARKGRWAEAAKAADRANRTLHQFGHRALPILSEREQLAFLYVRQRRALDFSLSLPLARPTDATLAARSVEWALNGKGVAQRALAQRYRLAQDGGDRQQNEAWLALATVRRRLSALATGTGRENDREAAALVAQEEELSRRLGQVIGQPARDPWLTLADIRKALPVGSVLIDIARVRAWDFQGKGTLPGPGGARYLAWVVPPEGRGEVKILDLGDAEVIEGEICCFRTALESAGRTIFREGEKDAEAILLRRLQSLAQSTLRPLGKAVAESEHWIICPDAALWLVPWAGLPLEKGGYAVEKHRISYVTSAWDLVEQGHKRAEGRALVVADPLYDLDLARVPAAREGTLAIVQRSGVPRDHRWGRLPGTAAEARAVVGQMAGYLGARPDVHTGAAARESVVKRASQPRALVLCTHGYVLTDQIEDGKNRPEEALENPLLRCGLVFAGANNRSRLKDETMDDGILTGLEIVGIDLRGTELVVLSACETGVGEVRNGEGVAGLRQAFQLAGARGVLATLWQVPDAETAELMTVFWEKLGAGSDRVEALRAAQLALIEKRRARKQAAHPLFWAAFTLTGQWK